jgi:cell division protein FtsQ
MRNARPLTVAPRATLMVPRDRPQRAVDLATKDAFITGQRHGARRLRRLRRIFRVLGALAVSSLAVAALGVTGVAAAHVLQTTSLLTIRRIEVTGAARVPEAAVLAAARIEPGTNLLALDVEAVVDRVESVPGVRRVRVVRHLPDRVALVVEEREPFALVLVGGAAGGLFSVDADGYLVGRERRPTAPALPILSGVELPSASGEHPVGDRLHAGLALLRAIQHAGGQVVRRVSEVSMERAGSPLLYTNEGIQVWIGDEAWDERLARLDGVFGEIEERGQPVESVDLRFRDLVVWRPRASNANGANRGQRER